MGRTRKRRTCFWYGNQFYYVRHGNFYHQRVFLFLIQCLFCFYFVRSSLSSFVQHQFLFALHLRAVLVLIRWHRARIVLNSKMLNAKWQEHSLECFSKVVLDMLVYLHRVWFFYKSQPAYVHIVCGTHIHIYVLRLTRIWMRDITFNFILVFEYIFNICGSGNQPIFFLAATHKVSRDLFQPHIYSCLAQSVIEFFFRQFCLE